MGLVVYWYDVVCFGIVTAAVVGAIVVLIRNEGKGIRSWSCAGGDGEPKYESLLLPTLEDEQTHYRKGFVSADCLWMPCWRCIHPALLCMFRIVAFVVMVLLLAWDIKDWGASIFIYYTEWTFTLVIIYFALATLISAKGCSQLARRDSIRDRDERSNFLKMDQERGAHINARPGTVNFQSHQEWEEQKRRAGFLGYVMLIIFQTCAGAVVMTDIVFWLIIVPFLSTKRFSLNLLMGSMHSVNAFLLLIDAALNSMRFPWFRGAYFVLWTAGYVIFQWIIHACGFSWWPYPFLELSTPWAPLWYFSLAIMCIICYGIFAILIKLKECLFPKWFPYSYQSLY